MPKVSLVLGRRTLNVFDFDRNEISIGRSPDADITIDNEAVSRRHAEIVRTPDGWIVRDTGSANGTFLNGTRLDRPRPLKSGDEISIGKFSIFFGKVMGETDLGATRRTLSPTEQESQRRSPEPAAPQNPAPPATPTPSRAPAPPEPPPVGGTRFIKPHEVEQLRKAAAERRKATVTWEAGGRRGEKPLPNEGALLVGTGDLCDLQTPKGPKHHLLFTRLGGGWEVRNLSWWHGMKVNGSKASRSVLSDGDTIEIGGLTVTFAGEVQ